MVRRRQALWKRGGQAYNPSTGTYGATRQASNANGNYGSSVVSKNGQPRTPSIKPPRKDLWEQYKLRRVPKARPRRAQMAIRCRRANCKWQQVCGRPTAMSTRTPGVVGPKPRELQPEIHFELLGRQLDCCSRLWRAGKERRVSGLWRRRKWLAKQRGEHPGLCKPRWWWRAQVKIANETSSLGSVRKESYSSSCWGM